MKIDFSIIIPTYNEEKNIERAITLVNRYFAQKRLSCEIIVVDDCSVDKTVEKVQALQKKFSNLKLLRLSQNYHKGWPVKQGMLAGRGKYLLFTDADLATPIEEVDKLFEAIGKGADVAIGSRVQPSGIDLRLSQPLYRRLLGKLFTLLMRLLIPEIIDSQCGFKLFKNTAAKQLFTKQRIQNIVFDVEILYLAKKLGLKVAQVPVVWNYSGETRMRVNFKNGIQVMSSLLKIWLWHH